MKRERFKIYTLIAILLLGFTACGGDESEGTDPGNRNFSIPGSLATFYFENIRASNGWEFRQLRSNGSGLATVIVKTPYEDQPYLGTVVAAGNGAFLKLILRDLSHPDWTPPAGQMINLNLGMRDASSPCGHGTVHTYRDYSGRIQLWLDTAGQYDVDWDYVTIDQINEFYLPVSC